MATRYAPLRSGDEGLDRAQDEIARVLNPALKRIADLGAAPVVSGSKGGNAALTSLISALVSLGLITDRTT